MCRRVQVGVAHGSAPSRCVLAARAAGPIVDTTPERVRMTMNHLLGGVKTCRIERSRRIAIGQTTSTGPVPRARHDSGADGDRADRGAGGTGRTAVGPPGPASSPRPGGHADATGRTGAAGPHPAR